MLGLAALGAMLGIWCSRVSRVYARLLGAHAHPDASSLLAALGYAAGLRRHAGSRAGPAMLRLRQRAGLSRRLGGVDLAAAAILAVAFITVPTCHGSGWRALPLAMACVMLMLLALIDARTRLLPDALTLPLLWLGLAVAWMGWGGVSLQDAVAGAMAGYLFLWLILQGFRLLRGIQGMGHGDLKLLAALGAWLGWQVLPWVILLACLAGIAFAMWRQKTLLPAGAYPFGPFLAAAGLCAFAARSGLHLCFY